MYPKPEHIKQARISAGDMLGLGRALPQEKSASLVYVTAKTWRTWESGAYAMNRGLFELFLIKTGQHMPASATNTSNLYPSQGPKKRTAQRNTGAASKAYIVILCYIGLPIFKIFGYIGPSIFQNFAI